MSSLFSFSPRFAQVQDTNRRLLLIVAIGLAVDLYMIGRQQLLAPWQLRKYAGYASPLYLVLILNIALGLGVNNLLNHIPVASFSQSWRIFKGNMGLTGLIPGLSNARCEQYAQIVPGKDHILALNSILSTLPMCYGSPLLDRTK